MKTKLGFYWPSNAWYAKQLGCKEEVSIGLFYDDLSIEGEFVIKWITAGNKKVPQIQCFYDGINALEKALPHLLTVLSENSTEEQVVDALILDGIADLTPYKRK